MVVVTTGGIHFFSFLFSFDHSEEVATALKFERTRFFGAQNQFETASLVPTLGDFLTENDSVGTKAGEVSDRP